LRRVPELPDVVVDAASGLKILCIVAGMRPFICFAERQEEDARPGLFEVLDGGEKCDGVERLFAQGIRQLFL